MRFRSLPARRSALVALARIDPAHAFRRDFPFPERRPSLQVIHDELAGGEGFAAMRAGHGDQHDLVARLERADAVDDSVA